MKVVILAGGMGSRISEESHLRPKPMIEIGGKPILWHIMNIYSKCGLWEYIICCGYKGYMIKHYFTHYLMYQSDSIFHTIDHKSETYLKKIEPWKITLADTGLKTLTAGRILKIREYIGTDEEFMLTYGDGVSDIDIVKLLEFHRNMGKLVTVTTTQPSGRFGVVKTDKYGIVKSFKEKERNDQACVNAGFMVLNRKIFDYLGDGGEMLEEGPFEKLVAENQMCAYHHNGFWSPMDTMRDKEYLEKLWNSGNAPW